MDVLWTGEVRGKETRIIQQRLTGNLYVQTMDDYSRWQDSHRFMKDDWDHALILEMLSTPT